MRVRRELGDARRLPMGQGGYELLHRLARGGMAEVFLARRHGLAGVEQTVVIKRLRRELEKDAKIARMFRWEAWISSRLAHPNIARFIDLVRHHGRYHLVLEHVDGSDLSTIVRWLGASGSRLPVRAVVEIAIGVARALDHAHRLADEVGNPVGLIHRDISPQNVIVSTEGEVKVVDFGVAKTTSKDVPRHTTRGLLKGKMAYIAPEQLRGEPMDARSDLFSLGVVLHELLAGKRLFLRATDQDTIRAVLAGAVPHAAAQRPDSPRALDAIVRRAVAQAPDDRFASASEMLRALVEVQAQLASSKASSEASSKASSEASDTEARDLSELAREARPVRAAAARRVARGAQAFPVEETAPPRDAPTHVEGAVRRRVAWARTPRLAALVAAFAVGAAIMAVISHGSRAEQHEPAPK